MARKKTPKTTGQPARPVPPHIVAGIEALFVELAKEERRRHRVKYSQKRPKDGEREELSPQNKTLPIRAKIGKLVAEYVGDHDSRSEVYGQDQFVQRVDSVVHTVVQDYMVHRCIGVIGSGHFDPSVIGRVGGPPGIERTGFETLVERE